jgi:SAM-dependent methyltransferase
MAYSSKDADERSAGRLADALRRIYERHQPPVPWIDGTSLPWHEPGFNRRMLAQHLDQNHGAASRPEREIRAQVQQMTGWLGLASSQRLFDVTCGPGLYAYHFARAGLAVSGIDIGPASIDYARRLCAGLPCDFTLGDVRTMDFAKGQFDAAIYLYGQFTVLRPAESSDVLRRIHAALRPAARILLEVLDYERFDKLDDTWWYTQEGELWGDFPYLHLGERHWDPEQQAAIERFYILNLSNGELQTYGLSDQAYTGAQIAEMLAGAGFANVAAHPAWGGLALRDAEEWVVYVAEKVT